MSCICCSSRSAAAVPTFPLVSAVELPELAATLHGALGARLVVPPSQALTSSSGGVRGVRRVLFGHTAPSVSRAKAVRPVVPVGIGKLL